MRRVDGREREDDRRPREGGFALLVALLAIVGLTALVTGGFLLADTERAGSVSFHRSVQALYLARAGLSDFLAGPPARGSAPVVYRYRDGTARVAARRMAELADGDAVYRITSRGSVRRGMDGTANRTVAVLAVFDRPIARLPAAMVSGRAVRAGDASAELLGFDAASPGCPPFDRDVAGLQVPPDGAPGYGAVGGARVDGLPPVREAAAPLSGLGVDWPALLARQGIRFAHVSAGAAPGPGWPRPDTLPAGARPAVLAASPAGLSVGDGDGGRGLLAVRGDLTIRGDFTWNGLVLVGGGVTVESGRPRISGGIVAGLGDVRGGPPAAPSSPLDLTGSGLALRYNSCEVDETIRSAGSFVEREATWSEVY